MRTIHSLPSGELRGVPPIIVGNRDFAALRALVECHGDGPDAHHAEQLDEALQRAIVVPQAQVPPEVVTVDSRVAIQELETLLRREFALSLPAGPRSSARLSVLSPLGVALLGAAVGETVDYEMPYGHPGQARILSVSRGGDRS